MDDPDEYYCVLCGVPFDILAEVYRLGTIDEQNVQWTQKFGFRESYHTSFLLRSLQRQSTILISKAPTMVKIGTFQPLGRRLPT